MFIKIRNYDIIENSHKTVIKYKLCWALNHTDSNMLDDKCTFSSTVSAESRAATSLFQHKLPHNIFCWLLIWFWETNGLQEDTEQHRSRRYNSTDPQHPVVRDHQNMVTLPTANFIITSNICLPAGRGPDFSLEQQMLLSRPFRIAQQAWNQILHSGALTSSVLFPQLPRSTCIHFASLQHASVSAHRSVGVHV